MKTLLKAVDYLFLMLLGAFLLETKSITASSKKFSFEE